MTDDGRGHLSAKVVDDFSCSLDQFKGERQVDGKYTKTFNYVAVEKTDNLPGGVTNQTRSVAFTVRWPSRQG